MTDCFLAHTDAASRVVRERLLVVLGLWMSCFRQHSYHIKNFMMRGGLLLKAASLFDTGDTILILGLAVVCFFFSAVHSLIKVYQTLFFCSCIL